MQGEPDADLAMALELQQQFDQEQAEYDEQEASRRHLTPYSKVVLDSSLPPAPRRPVHDDDEDEDEDGFVDEEGAGDLDPDMFCSPNQNQRMAKGAFLASTHVNEVVWRTKHDAEITGHRNTLYLEQTHPQQNLGSLEGIKLSNPVFNSMMTHAEKAGRSGVRKKFGKSELATREQVLDPSTRKLLFSMVNSGTICDLHGAISTGKESVVYHATGPEEVEYAVKIFKTTLTEFRSRTKYVQGEHRFRHSLKSQNPRKFIRLWAEKEMRNLKRAERVGLRCPRAVLLKRHVLLMEFVGHDGKAAPKLAEARLSKPKSILSAYEQCATMMRKLFIECRLVHADLSEFNMLWSKKKLWFIDLAQGVEWDHPNALRFLRDDCLHVTDFFRGRGLQNVLSVRGLYEYVTAETEGDLFAAMESVCIEAGDSDDQVWFSAFLPQRLSDIRDPVAASEFGQDSFHGDMLVGDNCDLDDDDDDDDDEEDSDSDSLSADEEWQERIPKNRNRKNR